MKYKTKVLALFMALVMIGVIITACGQQKASPEKQSTAGQEQNATGQNTEKETAPQNGPAYLNANGLPIVKEKINIKIMVGRHPLQPADWSTVLVCQEAEKRTGIHIDWDLVPNANLKERKNIVLASGDLPDAFMRAGIDTTDLVTYGGQEVFVKLNDLIDKYAPNLKAALGRFPQARKGITAPDGNIYSMPWLSDMLSSNVNYKLFVNQKWLDAVNMKMPTTTDELYEVLKAFKDKDPNGNGQKDEIPLLVMNMDGLIKTFEGAWGLANRGSQHSYVDIDESSGELRFIPIDPRYKEMLQYISKLYKEGLIDQEVLAEMNDQQVTAKGDKDLFGAISIFNTIPIGSVHSKEFVGIPAALKGPHGDQQWTFVDSGVKDPASFVITKANKYPEATVRWGDYFYSDEGMALWWMGVEGKTYYINEKGEYRHTDEIMHNPKGLTVDEATAQYIVRFGGGPTIKTLKYSMDSGEGLPAVLDATEKLKPYLPKEMWPPFLFTVEENERMMALSNDITTYVNEMRVQFITGKASFEQWDNYVNKLKGMGLDEYMNIYKAAYERYKKN